MLSTLEDYDPKLSIRDDYDPNLSIREDYDPKLSRRNRPCFWTGDYERQWSTTQFSGT